MLALLLAQFPVLAFARHQAERRVADRAAHEHAITRAGSGAAHHRSFRHTAKHRNGNRDRPRRPVGVPAEQRACEQDGIAAQPLRKPFEPIIANVLGQRECQKKSQRPCTFRSQIRQIHAQSLAGDRTRGVLGKKVHAPDNGVGLQHKIAACRWFNECGVIRQAKRAGIGRDGLEEPRDQAILGRPIVAPRHRFTRWRGRIRRRAGGARVGREPH